MPDNTTTWYSTRAPRSDHQRTALTLLSFAFSSWTFVVFDEVLVLPPLCDALRILLEDAVDETDGAPFPEALRFALLMFVPIM